MSRFDSIGLFWADVPQGRKATDRIRIRPPVPETGWKAPTAFPNLAAARVLSFDTETKDPEILVSGPGWSRNKGHIVGFSIGAKDVVGNVGQWYFPIRHEDTPEDNLDADQCLRWAKSQLETPAIPKVGANLTYDYGWLLEEGIRVMGPLFDVQFAEALLDERARVGLDSLAQKYLNEHKQGSLLYRWCADFYGGNDNDTQRKNIYRSPPSLVGPYGESDASLPLKIMEYQWPLLAREGLLDLFHMECELIPLMVGMRRRGVPVNVQLAEEMYDGLGKEVDVLNVRLREMVGFGVNVNSSEDLARAFTAHSIPYYRTASTERAPDGKPSFKAGFLEDVEHPIGQLIVDIRQREKLRSVFIKSYILDNHINDVVHGTFNQLRGEKGGTRSGRLSSDTPNLQNIPIRTEIGKRIRSIFGDKYLPWRKYDYSQIEYRFLAHYAVDKGDGSADAVRAAYAHDPKTDYHVQTQNMVRTLSGLEIQRSHIKNMNFGLCIAEGELVLTREGLVPIEEVTLQHCLWDGVAWVTHDGVIFKGMKDTITYDGLCATADHVIWTCDGRKIPIGRAASARDRLCRTGDGIIAHAARFADNNSEDNEERRKLSLCRRILYSMQKYAKTQCRQHTSTKDKRLRVSTQSQIRQRPTSKHDRFTLRLYGTALRARISSSMARLQGTWHKSVIYFARTFCKMGSIEVALHRFQRLRVRQNRQRWALRARQSTSIDQPREQTYSTPARVYDILNAGPRRRFTCSNVLVSNCYGMGETKLAKMLGVTTAKAKEMFTAYHAGAPYAKETMKACIEEASLYGTITTILGRKSRFDLWQPTAYDVDGVPMSYTNALMKYGNIKRAYTHKALNRRLQGSAADQMKKAMHRCYVDGIFDETGFPSLTVHDELDFIDPGGKDEAFIAMKRTMETCIELRVPVIADYEIGDDWGSVGNPADWKNKKKQGF